jgi:tetratricopeptide (TPR) repeat protein/transcriptional regulator with XRE-family HTH domain
MHSSLALSSENWKNTTAFSAKIPHTRRRIDMNDHVAREKHHGAIVAAYRVAKGWSQQRLANELEVDLTTVQRMEKLPMIKNVSRRWFLVGMLGIPASLLGLEGESPHTEKLGLAVNADYMTFLENQMSTLWEIYFMGGSSKVANGLGLWINEITGFAESAQGTPWHQRTQSLLCMSYQLQGGVVKGSQAQLAYQQAYRVAKELNDPELMAAALARRGTTFIWQEKPTDAITVLNGALHLINGHGFPQLRGRIFNALSLAYAQTQQPKDCWHTIRLAESAIDDRAHRQERSWVLFDTNLITAQKGINALFLGDYHRACALIDKSLINCSPTWIPGHARLLARKAEAYHGLGEVDECIAAAQEAFILASSIKSQRTITQVRNLHLSLAQSRWKNEPVVARLGALLAAHGV